MWYAGLDWADDHHDVVIIDEAAHQIASKRVAHTKEGVEELISLLKSIAGPSFREQLACIVETTRGLLLTALLEAGFSVYPVNPKTIDRRRVASGAKTDRIDAYVLAKLGRSDLVDLRRLKPDSPRIAELKALTRDQDALVHLQTSLVNQLIACLKTFSPTALQLFPKLHQRSTLVFLQTYPTPQEARSATLPEIEATRRKGGHTNPSKVASTIVEKLHQPGLQADTITTRTKSRLMLVLIGQLLSLIEQIAAYDKAIEDLFLTHADSQIFASLPRAGKRLAPRLLAELGDDRDRYQDARSLQALAGTAPVLYQSGTYQKAHRRSACLKPLRNALYLFAWQSTRSEPWALEYYRRKRKEGKSHSVAVRALSNLWLRIIYAMWTSKQPYQRTTFDQARQRHAPKAA